MTTRFRFACAIAMLLGVGSARADIAPGPSSRPRRAVPAVGTVAHIGQSGPVAIDVVVQGPSALATPLQIACVFEYVEGDLTTPPALPAALNGMRHLDEALHGLITDLRKSGRFSGHSLETLLIVPPKGAIAAERLLLIGLGNRNQLTPAVLQQVGAVGMREALRLGVRSYAHASDIKDAGVDAPVGPNAAAVLTGALDALATQRYLADKGVAPAPSVGLVTLLAGPSFFAETLDAVRETLAHPPRR